MPGDIRQREALPERTSGAHMVSVSRSFVFGGARLPLDCVPFHLWIGGEDAGVLGTFGARIGNEYANEWRAWLRYGILRLERDSCSRSWDSPAARRKGLASLAVGVNHADLSQPFRFRLRNLCVEEECSLPTVTIRA